jgi:hypothetical protein
MSLVALNGLPHHEDTTLDGAAMYARIGWQVFPCAGKQPITSDGFKGASADPERVAAMWRANPTANVGWAVPVGWFALDVDPRHGGDASLLELQREHGPLPWTLRAKTGGGGEHWIYRVPAGVEIRQMAGFRPGLDTRLGGRGYLLVSPSIHPETKQPYRWYCHAEPVDPPAWLVEMLRAPKAEPRAPYTPPTASREMDKRRRYALAALKGCAEDVRAAGKGGRNDALNKAWWRMQQFRDAVSLDESRAALADAAAAIGLPDGETARTLR